MANDFYNHSTYPATGSSGSSSSMRNELDLIAAGFEKLPALSGNAGKFALINTTSNGLTISSVLYQSVAGNIGVGTASPAQTLDVVRNQNAYTAAVVRNGDTGASAGAQVIVNSDGTVGRLVAYSSGNTGGLANAVALEQSTANPILFFIGGAECARISAAGNVGLATTPNSWGGGFSGLQISTGFGGFAANANADTRIYSGAYFGASNDTYSVTGRAVSMYRQLDGAHTWFTAPSGTAGNVASFSQVLTLDAAGRLGVGKTPSGQMLDVAGSGAFRSTVSNTTGLTVEATSGFVSNFQLLRVGVAGWFLGSRDEASSLSLSVDDATHATPALEIDASRNVQTYVGAAPPPLPRNNEMVFNLTSNTNLRVSVRGSDGVTRVANIALA